MTYRPFTLDSLEDLRRVNAEPGETVPCDEGEDIIRMADGFEWSRWTGVPTGNSDRDRKLNEYMKSGNWTIVGIFDYTLLLQRPKYITYVGRRKS